MELYCVAYICHPSPTPYTLAPSALQETMLNTDCLWSSSSVEEGLKMDLCKLGIQPLLFTELLESYCPVHGGPGDFWRGACER